MKKKQNAIKRFLAAFLTFAMVFSMMPTSMGYVAAEENVVAVEETAGDEVAVVTETEDTSEAEESTVIEETTETEESTDESTEGEEPAEGEETEGEETETPDPDAVKLQIKYGETIYKITEADWAKICEKYEATYKYSTNHRSAPVYGDEFTGVPLASIMEYLKLDTTVLKGDAIVTFRADDGATLTKLTLDAVFNTDRYCYTYDETNGTFVDDENKTEAPIIITSKATEANDRLGRLVVGMSAVDNGNGEFVKQYWWNGLFNTAENEFISIEIPVPTGFASGTGTEADPYIISNAEELQNLANKVNAGDTFEGKYLKLSENIDLTTLKDEEGNSMNWTPIGGGDKLDDGTATYKFMGNFNGNGKAVTYSIVDEGNYLGLFGYNGGTISNLTVNATITGTFTHESLQDSKVTNDIHYDYVGGLCGFNAGTIKGVVANVTMSVATNEFDMHYYNVGGIAGINVGGDGKYVDEVKGRQTVSGAVGVITECASNGTMTTAGTAGGVTGKNYGTISYCYNTTDIDIKWNGSMSKNGGISGTLGDTGSEYGVGHIISCYNTGDIGWSGTASSRGYGGIVCFASVSSSITNCYSIGELEEGYDDWSPIIPRYDTTKYMINNYSLDTISSVNGTGDNACNGARRTEEQLKGAEFLTEIGGAFAADTNNLNNGYPVLKWQNGGSLTATKVEAESTEVTVVEGQKPTDILPTLKLYVVYSDGTKEYIPAGTYSTTWTDAFTMEDEGKTLTVSCSKGSVDLTIKMEQKVLNYIRVWSNPTKYVYNTGDTFDPTGMRIYAWYTNELLGTINYGEVTDYTWTTNGPLTEENNVVTVFYSQNGQTASVAFEVIVIDAGTEPATDENGVYQLATVEDLLWFQKQVTYLGNTTINAVLTADIDASEADLGPIGDNINKQVEQKITATKDGAAPSGTQRVYYYLQKQYAGTFDGNGHAITLNMNRTTQYAGLFGWTNGATIKNLTVKGSVTGTQYVAGINANGTATITNCTNEATITGSSNYVGGITAYGTTTVENCTNKGNVTGMSYVGGIDGRGSTKITGCGNEGDITANGSYAGGISSMGTATMNQNYNTGTIKGGSYVAGIIGYSSSNATIKNSYNKGDVEATENNIGGIVGNKGTYVTLTITGCYNTGDVTSTKDGAYVGEIVGYAGGSSTYMLIITNNNFYVQNEEGTKDSIGGTNKAEGVADGAKAKTLGELSGLAGTLGKSYQNSCGGPVFTTQEVVEHTFGEWTEDNATFTEDGLQTRTCEVCGLVEEQKTDATGVAETIKSIEAIGEVTLDSAEAIETARNNYDSLTDAQKAKVTNIDVLTAAEAKIVELRAASMNFEDVPADSWCYDYVEYVYANGIMSGRTDTRFGVQENLTRGQFITILYRMAGEPEVEFTKKFADVSEGKFFADAVIWASEVGIANGRVDGTFDPYGDVKRQELVAMMHRYAAYMGLDADQTADLTVYSDYESVAAYAKADMEWAVGAGIIQGTSEGKLNPTGPATRGQCAKIIALYMQQ